MLATVAKTAGVLGLFTFAVLHWKGILISVTLLAVVITLVTCCAAGLVNPACVNAKRR